MKVIRYMKESYLNKVVVALQKSERLIFGARNKKELKLLGDVSINIGRLLNYSDTPQVAYY